MQVPGDEEPAVSRIHVRQSSMCHRNRNGMERVKLSPRIDTIVDAARKSAGATCPRYVDTGLCSVYPAAHESSEGAAVVGVRGLRGPGF